jgi:ABC-type transport system substrate-binding protein
MSAERQVSAVERGSADLMLDRIPSDRMTEVSVHYPAQLHPQALPETDFINLDVHASPFTDVRARQALACASIEPGSCSERATSIHDPHAR